MPRTRTVPSVSGPDVWRTCAPPQTPLQQGAFLDLCTRWLMQEPSPSQAVHDFDRLQDRTTWRGSAGPKHVTSRLAHTHSELRTQVDQLCAFCKHDAGVRPVVANGFAQRCLVLLCHDCRAR